MKKKISDKDKKDWNNFILKKDKLPNKDLYFKKDKTNNISKTIDLHGFSLEEANEIIEKLIEDCFEKGFSKMKRAVYFPEAPLPACFVFL